MIKTIECPHIPKSKTFYIYRIINADLILCPKCEKKLRKQIFEQDKIEKGD